VANEIIKSPLRRDVEVFLTLQPFDKDMR